MVLSLSAFIISQVGSLLARDSVKNRMASGDGLSYTEMSYQLMQAHDFAFLHKEFGCTVQLGGADQWGNIVGGIELVRKVHNSEVHAMTIPLVLNSCGEKLGKSAGNAVWLRQDMTSLYTFRLDFLLLPLSASLLMLPQAISVQH